MSHLHLSAGLHPGVVWQATPPSEVLQRQAPLDLQEEGHFTLKWTPCQVGLVWKLAELNKRWKRLGLDCQVYAKHVCSLQEYGGRVASHTSSSCSTASQS